MAHRHGPRPHSGVAHRGGQSAAPSAPGHGNTGRHYTTGRADRGRADRAYYDGGAKYASRSTPYSRADKYARAARDDDAPYNPDEPQFVPSERGRARSREYYASMLADGFRLVDAKPNPENVGIFQGIFALVDGVYPDIVSDEHRERHGFLTCMRGVQCMLERIAADT
jgi:hypothetical protein